MKFRECGHQTPSYDLQVLQKLVKAQAQPVCLEVGSWTGYSARAIAEVGVERLYCIDHWKGSKNDSLKEVAEHFTAKEIQRAFCQNMGEHLLKTVIPLTGTSKFWSGLWPDSVKLNLIYIDAEHDFKNAYRDIQRWFKHLAHDGTICGHDYYMPGVTQAVHDCFVNGTIKHEHNVWWWER